MIIWLFFLRENAQRLAEMKAMTADRTRNERLRKEQKQAEREMERLKKQ